MHITLIKPNMVSPQKTYYRPRDVMQPLASAILAGLTPEDIDLSFYDERIEGIPFDQPTDLVAITVESHTAKRSYEIARRYRQRGTRVVLGGMHPSFASQEAAEHADCVAVGEAEGVWPQILEDARNNRLKRLYQTDNRCALTNIKSRRSIFKGKKYLPIDLVEFGRGCRYACDFCAASAFYKGYRHRPVAEVVSEIRQMDPRNIFFVDDNIAADPEASFSLFKELIPLGIRWMGQISVEALKNEELVSLMAKSGCRILLVGLESLNKKNLSQMSKASNLGTEDYEQPIKILKKHGIKVYGTFVFGYDDDNRESFEEAVKFSLKHKFFIANFNLLMPYVGTRLYERLKADGRLLFEKWWLDRDYRFGHAAFRPKFMSADDLTEGCFSARKEFNSYKNIFYRASDFHANSRTPKDLFEFFAYGFLVRKEVYRKQNIVLG